MGTLSLGRLVFLAATLPQLVPQDGVLSVRSFPPDRLVTFDYPAGRIRLDAGALAPGDPEVLPYEAEPVVTLRGTVAGRDLSFHVDTGSADGITLPGALARELEFEGELTVLRQRGPLVVKTGRLRGEVRLGHFTLSDPEVQVVDLFRGFGNIGSRFLRDRTLTLDRRQRTLRISPPQTVPATPR